MFERRIHHEHVTNTLLSDWRTLLIVVRTSTLFLDICVCAYSTCVPAQCGPQENAWHRAAECLSQIGIAPAARKANVQIMFSSSRVLSLVR